MIMGIFFMPDSCSHFEAIFCQKLPFREGGGGVQACLKTLKILERRLDLNSSPNVCFPLLGRADSEIEVHFDRPTFIFTVLSQNGDQVFFRYSDDILLH